MAATAAVQEEVAAEVEAVQAVYGDDCVVLESYPPHLHLHIKPHTADVASQQFVEAVIGIRAGSQYPNEPPHIDLIDSKGLDFQRQKHLTNSIRDRACELSSCLMLVAICEEAVEKLSVMNHPDGDCPLCLYPLVPEDEQSKVLTFMKLMSCFHCFHSECIIRWWNWIQTEERSNASDSSSAHLPPVRDLRNHKDTCGAVEESMGNCPVCRKVFHAEDFEHVLDLVGNHSSLLSVNDNEDDDGEKLLQSESENARRQNFEALLKLQQQNSGLIEPKNNVVLPGMLLPPPVASSTSETAKESAEEQQREPKVTSEMHSGGSSDGPNTHEQRSSSSRKQRVCNTRRPVKQRIKNLSWGPTVDPKKKQKKKKGEGSPGLEAEASITSTKTTTTETTSAVAPQGQCQKRPREEVPVSDSSDSDYDVTDGESESESDEREDASVSDLADFNTPPEKRLRPTTAEISQLITEQREAEEDRAAERARNMVADLENRRPPGHILLKCGVHKRIVRTKFSISEDSSAQTQSAGETTTPLIPVVATAIPLTPVAPVPASAPTSPFGYMRRTTSSVVISPLEMSQSVPLASATVEIPAVPSVYEPRAKPVVQAEITAQAETATEAETRLQSETIPQSASVEQMPIPASQPASIEQVIPQAPSQGQPSASEGTTSSSDELNRLFANLTEDTGCSSSAIPLSSEAQLALVELKRFLSVGIAHIADGAMFTEFKKCVDRATFHGLLNTEMLDEFHRRLDLGATAIPLFSYAQTQLAEAEDYSTFMEHARAATEPIMVEAQTKKEVAAQTQKKLADLDAQIAELQRMRSALAERYEAEKALALTAKEAGKKILQEYNEKQKAVMKVRLAQGRLRALMDDGEAAWKRITGLMWTMINEGI